jgi:hypothetical protein
VDGQQRIRTLISFIAPQLLVQAPTFEPVKISRAHNREHGDKTFRDLPKTVQQQILDYQFMVHIFPSDTDDRDILEIFARMNATGYKLNNQELRNATYFGEFKTLCYELAAEQLNRWRDLRLFSEDQIARMQEVELTSELLIVTLDGISEGSKATIDRYYKRFDDRFPNCGEVAKRFRYVMDVIIDRFSASARAPFGKKTLFYPLFAAIYACTYGLNSAIKSVKPPKIAQRDITAIASAGKRLDAGTGPAEIVELTQRRVSQAGVRRRITRYLLTHATGTAWPLCQGVFIDAARYRTHSESRRGTSCAETIAIKRCRDSIRRVVPANSCFF